MSACTAGNSITERSVISLPLQIDRRSVVVTGAFLVQAVTIGFMFAYGVFFSELEHEFGWSRTMLSTASSVGFLSMGLLAIVAGRLNDRFGPRWVLTVTGLFTGLAYLCLLYTSPSPRDLSTSRMPSSA